MSGSKGNIRRLACPVAIAALVWAGITPQSATATDETVDCSAPMNTVEMHYCADEAYKAADGDLNQVWQTMRGHLSKEEKAALLTAQRAWLKYRDANCDFAAMPYLGGTLHPVILLTCLESMTRTRTEELRAMLERN